MNSKKIAIVTDTNSSITTEEADKLGIYMVNMPFIINGSIYHENVNLTHAQFYMEMEKGSDISTSQPSPGDLMDLWDEILESYDCILHIPMAAGLSGSMASAKMIAEDYDGKVVVVNNERISISLRQAVLDALKWVAEGFSAEEIKEKLEATSADSSIYISVDDLKYLQKGGRISPSVAAIGSVFNIKPVLSVREGVIDSHKKCRGKKSAWKEMIRALKEDMETKFPGKELSICTAFSGDEAVGDEWHEAIKAAFPEYEVQNFKLPLSIATHTGPGVCGVGCMVIE